MSEFFFGIDAFWTFRDRNAFLFFGNIGLPAFVLFPSDHSRKIDRLYVHQIVMNVCIEGPGADGGKTLNGLRFMKDQMMDRFINRRKFICFYP